MPNDKSGPMRGREHFLMPQSQTNVQRLLLRVPQTDPARPLRPYLPRRLDVEPVPRSPSQLVQTPQSPEEVRIEISSPDRVARLSELGKEAPPVAVFFSHVD